MRHKFLAGLLIGAFLGGLMGPPIWDLVSQVL